MKQTKFWITAAATVATAGMLGVAIAQTQTQPVPQANETKTNERGSLPPSGNSNSMNTGTTTGDSKSMNSGSTTGNSSSTTTDSTSNTNVARADRG